MPNPQITMRLTQHMRDRARELREYLKILNLQIEGQEGLPQIFRWCLEDSHRRYSQMVSAKAHRAQREKQYPVVERRPRKIPRAGQPQNFHCHGKCSRFVMSVPEVRKSDGQQICNMCALKEAVD